MQHWAIKYLITLPFLSLAVSCFGDTLVVCDGDSLTVGSGSSNPATKSYPAQMVLGGGYTVMNTGVGGEKIQNNTGATRVLSAFAGAASGANLICVINEGINDLGGGNSAANVITYIDAYIATVRAAYPAAKIVGLTLTYDVDLGPHTSVDTINTHIKTVANFDYTVDLLSDARLVDPTDTTYYTDGLHRTDAGYLVEAQMVQAAILAHQPGNALYRNKGRSSRSAGVIP